MWMFFLRMVDMAVLTNTMSGYVITVGHVFRKVLSETLRLFQPPVFRKVLSETFRLLRPPVSRKVLSGVVITPPKVTL